jgi:hypothetical protein
MISEPAQSKSLELWTFEVYVGLFALQFIKVSHLDGELGS